jgi:hypothetical protein
MIGKLLINKGNWVVVFPQQSKISTYNGGVLNQDSIGSLPIHPDTPREQLIDGNEIEYEIVKKYIEPDESIHCNRGSDVKFAKIINRKMMFWEILVPTKMNEGVPIRTRFHKVWDEKVREITGGLAIIPPIKGQWISNDGELFSERMIPVRICCNEEQIELIADMTSKYYKQTAIMYYLITDKVKIKHYL